jgi:hypothetical protein
MKEIEQAIEQKLPQVREENREEYRDLSIRLARLQLDRGDSVSSIVEFILS